jgi:hypothetical protein
LTTVPAKTRERSRAPTVRTASRSLAFPFVPLRGDSLRGFELGDVGEERRQRDGRRRKYALPSRCDAISRA